MSDNARLSLVLFQVATALRTLPEDALGYGESGGARWPLRDELIDSIILVAPDPAEMRKAIYEAERAAAIRDGVGL